MPTFPQPIYSQHALQPAYGNAPAHLLAAAGFTTATELADTLVREAGLPFRLAHKVVAQMVQTAVRNGVSSAALTPAMLQTAADQILGGPLNFSAEQFERALDPQLFIHARAGLGGVAPAATATLIDHQQAALRQRPGMASRNRDASSTRPTHCGARRWIY